MAEIVPFPAERRVGFIRDQAADLASLAPAAAEKRLAALLRREMARLEKVGMPPDAAYSQAKRLELAVRRTWWGEARRPGPGGAA